MNSDPILEGIRRGRQEHAAKFQHVMKAICDDFRQRENDLRDRLVAPPPKRASGREIDTHRA